MAVAQNRLQRKAWSTLPRCRVIIAECSRQKEKPSSYFNVVSHGYIQCKVDTGNGVKKEGER